MPYYPHPDWQDIQKHIFIKGIITSVDSENDTADVTVPGGSDGTVAGYQDGSDIPIFYHCSDDAEERSNGAIEGGSSPFSEDDEVIVMCEADTGLPVRIIGFVDGIRQCAFQFRIIREFDDDYIVTDAMTLDEGLGEYFPDDFQNSGSFIWFKVYSNLGYQIVVYGHNTEENWERYHPDDDIDDFNPECMATYNEETQVWTVPIPEAIRDSAGYLVTIDITDSIETQFLTPVESDPPYPYVWKIGENILELPYIRQEDNEGYINLAKPGSYDFPVPCHRNLGTTIAPDVEYSRMWTSPLAWVKTTSWEGDLPCRLWGSTVNAWILGDSMDPSHPDHKDVEIVFSGPGMGGSVTNIIPTTVGSISQVAGIGSATVSMSISSDATTFFTYDYPFNQLARTNLVIDYT